MSEARTIIDALQKIAGVQLKNNIFILPATVLSVNEAERTCVVETIGGDQAIEIEGVQLMASVDDGVLLVPTVGSTVNVNYSTYYAPFLCQFSGVDKVLVVVGENAVAVEVTNTGVLVELNDTKISLTDGKIQFNDGAFDGLVKVEQLTQKLNTIENSINALKQVFSTWTPVPQDGGAALKGAVSSWAGQQLQPTQQSQIENTKVTHG